MNKPNELAVILRAYAEDSPTTLCNGNLLLRAANEIERLNAELAAYNAAFPHCAKHAPNGSRRSGCLVCGIAELDLALSQIDYLCGDPNEMLSSAYAVHCNPEMVVNAVERLREQLERKA